MDGVSHSTRFAWEGAGSMGVALVIDEDTHWRARLAHVLSEAGWHEHNCPGPPFVVCPIGERGKLCPYARKADVVVISVGHPRFGELLDGYTRLAPEKGVVVILREGAEHIVDGGAFDATAYRESPASLRAACLEAAAAAARRRALLPVG